MIMCIVTLAAFWSLQPYRRYAWSKLCCFLGSARCLQRQQLPNVSKYRFFLLKQITDNNLVGCMHSKSKGVLADVQIFV